MRIDPDFPDHWKTRLLIGALDGDEAAPIYVLRLWAHCQMRRQSEFDNLSSEALKALCRFPGHSNQLESSLVASGFVRRDAKKLVVCGWDEYNASLIAAWNNGQKGGRPPKIPRETPGEPLETQGVTQEKPRGSRLDKSRLDTIRKEPPRVPLGLLFPDGMDTSEVRQAVQDWLAYRRTLGKPLKMPKSQVERLLRRKDWVGNPTAFCEAVDHSIAQGYQGCYPSGKGQSYGQQNESGARVRERDISQDDRHYRGAGDSVAETG